MALSATATIIIYSGIEIIDDDDEDDDKRTSKLSKYVAVVTKPNNFLTNMTKVEWTVGSSLLPFLCCWGEE